MNLRRALLNAKTEIGWLCCSIEEASEQAETAGEQGCAEECRVIVAVMREEFLLRLSSALAALPEEEEDDDEREEADGFIRVG